MKKTLTALVVLGGIAAAVGYKLKKKEQEERALDLELSLLEEESEANTQTSISTEADHYPDLNKQNLEDLNETIIKQLENDGDNHEDERPIQHSVSFKGEQELQDFKQVVVEKGYVVTRGEGEFELYILHIATINKTELLSHIYFIANCATHHNGIYKGWTARVSN